MKRDMKYETKQYSSILDVEKQILQSLKQNKL